MAKDIVELGPRKPRKERKLSREDLERELLRFEQDGTISTEAIVAAARDRNHPLHGEFIWSDKIAGHLYRLGQAAQLVRRLVEPADEDGDGPVLVRSFVSRLEDRTHHPKVFVRRRLCLDDSLDRLDIMVDALQKSRGLLQNVGARELHSVLLVIDPLLASLQRQRSLLLLGEARPAA